MNIHFLHSSDEWKLLTKYIQRSSFPRFLLIRTNGTIPDSFIWNDLCPYTPKYSDKIKTSNLLWRLPPRIIFSFAKHFMRFSYWIDSSKHFNIFRSLCFHFTLDDATSPFARRHRWLVQLEWFASNYIKNIKLHKMHSALRLVLV